MPVVEAAAPGTSAAVRERALAIEQALTKVSRRQREMLHLTFYPDMTIEEAAMTPSFDSVLVRRRQPQKPALALVAVSVAGLVLVGLTVTLHQPAPAPVEISLREWRSPTAFLLEPPGDVLLYVVPALGSSDAEVFSCDGCF